MAKLKDIAKEESKTHLRKLKDHGKETVHAGGTPLFDETTGKYLSPVEVALRKNFKWKK